MENHIILIYVLVIIMKHGNLILFKLYINKWLKNKLKIIEKY